MDGFENPPPAEIAALLGRVTTIAVVGLSPKPRRPSHRVASRLQGFGYRIVPVRPAVAEILGETAYAKLADIPFTVDLVDVFRAPRYIPEVVEACRHLAPQALWLQEGVVHEAGAFKARQHGMVVVMDRCIYKDYVALMGAT